MQSVEQMFLMMVFGGFLPLVAGRTPQRCLVAQSLSCVSSLLPMKCSMPEALVLHCLSEQGGFPEMPWLPFFIFLLPLFCQKFLSVLILRLGCFLSINIRWVVCSQLVSFLVLYRRNQRYTIQQVRYFFLSNLPVTGSLTRQPKVLYNNGLSVPIGWAALF